MKKHTTIEILLLVGFCLSGASALIYEVVWTRALSLVMGSTTYALSTMLASFMAGLTVGGYIGGLWADRTKNPTFTFGLIEIGIAIFGLITFIVIKNLSPIYAWVFYTFHLSFSSFSFAQFIISFGLMLIPTTLMGATFPLVLKARAKSLNEIGRDTGNVYSINNLGAIIGSVAAGFILIPSLGSTVTILLAGIINFIVGSIILIYKNRAWKIAGCGVIVFILIYSSYQYLYTTQLYFSYYTAERWGSLSNFKMIRKKADLIFHKEGVQGDVMLFGGEPPVLINSGKLEGGETSFHALIGYIALMSHTFPKNILNIGLGSGNTLSTIVDNSFVKNVDSVEISPEIVEATKRFIRPALFFNPRINHIITDARFFLLLTPKRYDVIISVPSWPGEFASASLLTEEFFSLAKGHLNNNGIFAQWVDYYLLSKEDMRTFIRTFTKVFPFTTIWHTSGNVIILVGSQEPFALSTTEIKARVEGFVPEFKSIFFLGMTSEQIRNTKWSVGQINTDDLPVLEFHIAKSIILGEKSVRELNE